MGIPPGLGLVVLAGDADRVRLLGADGAMHPPGPLPPGSYQVRAWFKGMEPVSSGTVSVVAGAETVVTCAAALTVCR